jgi:hypothetical protein
LTIAATISLWATSVLAGFVQPIVTPTPVPLSFASVPLGSTSAPNTETYTVSGGGPGTGVVINSISASGDFAIAPGGTCATGFLNAVFSPGSCTVFVTFTPSAAGTRNGTLTFNCTSIAAPGGGAFSCAQTASNLLVALLGNGFAGSFAVPTLSSFALALLACALIFVSFLSLKRRRY